MAVFSVIKLSELEGAKRIDAEYYKPEYLELSSKISLKGYSKLGSISSLLTDGDHGNPEYSSDGIVFITSENLDELGVDAKSCNKISYEYAKKVRKDCFTTVGDVLLTTVGKIGISTIAKQSGIALSRDIARLVIKKNAFCPEFIVVWLNSKVGLSMTERESVGSVQKGLYLVHIKSLKVPQMSNILQNKIKQTFLKSIDFHKQGQFLYSQAENLLLEELGLKEFKPKYEKTYTAKLSDAFSAHRIDAEYFQPAYEEVIRKIEDITELKLLGKLANRVKLKIKPENNKLYRYIEISDVLIDIGEVNYTERLGKDLPPNARIPVKGGELIISKVRPTRGAIGIIPYCLGENLICSSAFSVFDVDSPLKEYLYVITRSIIGRLQLEKPTKGTSYPTIEDLDVEKLRIPILPLSTQQKIASLVQKSHEARRKAKELLEVAKRAVEIAIEKNEKEALDYISKTEER